MMVCRAPRCTLWRWPRPARRRLALPSIPWAAWAPASTPAAAPFVIGMTAAARLALTYAVVTALTGARHALLLIGVALF